MERRILIRGARQLLTLRGPGPRRGAQLSDLGIIEDGSVLVVGERIHSVGSARRMENLQAARGAEVIDASGKVVMPGFVDSHTHLVFPAPRLGDFERRIGGASYQAIASDGGGIGLSVRLLRAMSGRRLEAMALRWLRRFAACGTTTVEGKSGYGLDPAAEIKMLRVLRSIDGRPLEVARTFLGAHVPPPEFAADPDAYVTQVIDEMLPEVRRKRLAEFCDAWCDPGAFTVEQCRRILDAARSQGLRLKLHAEQHSSSGGARLAVELEAVSVDHLERLEGDDLDLVARSNTVATLLPGSVFYLASDCYAPARGLIDQGAAVALATDFNPGTSPTANMQMILALACSRMKMTPAEAIAAATINGAAALGRAGTTGSIEPDKYADIIVMDTGDYREIAYYFGMNLCRMTIRRGRVVWNRAEESDGGESEA